MTLVEDAEREIYRWSCDDCGRSITLEGGFWDCWSVAKRKGWVAIKNDEGEFERPTWSHMCKACRIPAKANDIMSRVYKGPRAIG